MDLVDEEQRPLPGLAPRARGVEYLLEIADAGKDRRDLLEMQVGRLRQEPRDRGLAGTGWPQKMSEPKVRKSSRRASAPSDPSR